MYDKHLLYPTRSQGRAVAVERAGLLSVEICDAVCMYVCVQMCIPYWRCRAWDNLWLCVTMCLGGTSPALGEEIQLSSLGSKLDPGWIHAICLSGEESQVPAESIPDQAIKPLSGEEIHVLTLPG